MTEMKPSVDRRDFLRGASGIGATLAFAGSALASRLAAAVQGRVLGANDRIQIGLIGAGGRGTYVAKKFAKIGEKNNSCKSRSPRLSPPSVRVSMVGP